MSRWEIKVPKVSQARMTTKVVFYKQLKTNFLAVGFPEHFPTPDGFEKIVCNTAHEVEMWSARLRQQEKDQAEMTDYQRELIEGPMRDYVRKELQHKMANARNNLNRDFCRWALTQLDEKDAKGKEIRESYMHAEAFESGK